MFDLDNEDLRWLDRAACSQKKISDFFVDAGHVISQENKAVCAACPVRRTCVQYGYQHRYGYFGGFSPGQRNNKPLTELLEIIEREEAAKTNLKK